MRPIRFPGEFTPVGIFMYQYCDPSETGLTIQNIDYMIHNWKRKLIMLIEEKTNGAQVTFSQSENIKQLDAALRHGGPATGLDYRGFFILQLPVGRTHIGPGMKLNNKLITVEQLVRHINFEEEVVTPLNPSLDGQMTFDREMRINGTS